MDQISNVATQAAYADALTLGPTNYEAISVNIWNNSCIAQTYELGPGGDYQTGSWGTQSASAEMFKNTSEKRRINVRLVEFGDPVNDGI